MLDKKMELALNNQLEKEAFSSYSYLAMAVWCDQKSMEGCSRFFYRQAEEEHLHMMKILAYLIERNGQPVIPAIKKPKADYKSIYEIFNQTFKQEKEVTQSIHDLINETQKLNDHSTQNFLQWYVSEQREEEAVVMKILDKIQLIGEGPMCLYYIDKEVEAINNQIVINEAKA
ncbi:MAG: ferritin [Saprospiraceae bacterium]|nr:ferritin [Saprospiraceae bacterium]MBK7360615.1 ferritin [Saprospiraceae bacterium]MBK7736406.1 ferritin [Saprospiraceae bacterium]MBK7912229.1 ferritin [Saprospiraceae bacterium]